MFLDNMNQEKCNCDRDICGGVEEVNLSCHCHSSPKEEHNPNNPPCGNSNCTVCNSKVPSPKVASDGVPSPQSTEVEECIHKRVIGDCPFSDCPNSELSSPKVASWIEEFDEQFDNRKVVGGRIFKDYCPYLKEDIKQLVNKFKV